MNRTIKLNPHKPNFALFIVGDGHPDEYTFSFESEPSGWKTNIEEIEWGEPVTIASSNLGVRMKAPADAAFGRVTIWVERASTSQRVPVEFELAAHPDAANCYRF